jgi:hypothetical protein
MLTSGGARTDDATSARTSAKEPVRLSDPVPQFTIGRTRRGWIWATLAMAAGIMIMFLQPGDEQNKNLPPVAVKSDGAVDKVAATDRIGVSELRQGKAPAAPQAVPAEAALEAPAMTGGEGGELLAAAKPQAMSRGQLRDESTSASDGAPAATATPASEDELLVVHIVVQQAAMENKSFDRLLTEQGIPVEEPPASGDAAISTEEIAAEQDEIARQLDRFTDEPQNADVVLVEAPAATIESFLAAINKDEQNYAGILVDDVSASDATAAFKSTTATNVLKKKLAYDLKTKFDRGQGPSPHDVELGRSSNLYYSQDGSYGPGGYGVYGGRGSYGGGLGGALKQEQESQRESSSLGLDVSKEVSQSRAIRLKLQQIKNRAGEQTAASVDRRRAVAPDQSASNEALRFGAVLQEATAPAAAAGDNLQVLFILSPASVETAPSPPADNRAK